MNCLDPRGGEKLLFSIEKQNWTEAKLLQSAVKVYKEYKFQFETSNLAVEFKTIYFPEKIISS